jgi:hypothetical protein
MTPQWKSFFSEADRGKERKKEKSIVKSAALIQVQWWVPVVSETEEAGRLLEPRSLRQAWKTYRDSIKKNVALHSHEDCFWLTENIFLQTQLAFIDTRYYKMFYTWCLKNKHAHRVYTRWRAYYFVYRNRDTMYKGKLYNQETNLGLSALIPTCFYWLMSA